MRFRLGRKKEPASTNANSDEQPIHHAEPPHQPPDNNTLQAILAAIYNALRPHPDALPAVESVLAKLLGPQSPTPNPTTTTPTTTINT